MNYFQTTTQPFAIHIKHINLTKETSYFRQHSLFKNSLEQEITHQRTLNLQYQFCSLKQT